ncbi:MAG: hypothetical protein QOG85_547 [Gaiellaceae bacterium]|nr:hypothetical protein [Gaiellaceae bacterium]
MIPRLREGGGRLTADLNSEMKKTPRLLLATAAVAALALAGSVAAASACGTNGYSYAGLGAPTYGSGISAVITPYGPFDIANGHVAGWVGVGGPGEGPNGADEWLQIGLSGFPGLFTDIYYEVTLPGRDPVYHEVLANPPAGHPYRFSVLETRPNLWRVLLNGEPVSPAYYLPQSHNKFIPIATAEAWDGGTGACNNFLYSFQRVKVAHRPGGLFHSFTGGFKIKSAKTTLRRAGTAFIAAEGAPSVRTLLLSSLLLLRP